MTEVDKFSDTLRNMSTWEKCPEGYDSEPIQLLLKSAEIANFAPEVRKKFIQDMTTAQDIANQLAYARKEGLKEGLKLDVSELEG